MKRPVAPTGRTLAALALVIAAWPARAFAQPVPSDAGSRAIAVAAGGRTWSMGQPPIYQWHTGLFVDVREPGGFAHVGVQKDLLNPMVGLAALRVEGVVGARNGRAEGGGRVLVVSPVGRVHAGLDVDARSGRLDVLAGLDLNIRRGGLFGHGSRLRIDWLPGRGHTVQAGVQLPLGQRAGTTRPRTDHVILPRVDPPTITVPAGAPEAGALREFRAAAEALTRLVIPLRSRLGGDAGAAVAPDVAALRQLGPPEQLSDAMMRCWFEVFSTALARRDAPLDQPTVERVATRARRIVLEDVLVPFAGRFGQRRSPATLTYHATAAARRFAAELAALDLSPAQREAASSAFLGAVHELDGVRAGIRKEWGSDRRVFVPLQLALPPAESDTQAEIDTLIERATGRQFRDGNRIAYVLNEAFQFEFMRTVRQAERYHVLWIHDVRGRGPHGDADRVSALHVQGYLATLAERVRKYDQAGELPQYFIFFDQFYYQGNNARLWMTILENPLERTIDLPAGSEVQQRALRAAQRDLRDAVAGSRLLQQRRAAFGDAWLRDLVKVHVSITHPSDFSFWARGLIKIVGVPDNLMRDHRKIVLYDITEDDPYRGEVIFSGMGLGEWYAGPTWEDRALLVEGPAALEVKSAIRRLFERQGIAATTLPEVFQPRPLAAGYDERVEAERRQSEARGFPSARALQAHNDVGFGEKQASVIKALLASLMPRGSVVIAPDSLWEDTLLGSLLVGSALRGCRVMVIAPAYDNAPGTAWPVVARTHMVLSRLLALSQHLDARMAAAGGLFKIGMFNEQSGVGDQAGRMDEMRRNLTAAKQWFRTLAPFDATGIERWTAQAREASRLSPPVYLATPETPMRPKLHMKGLYAASPAGWDGLFRLPGMIDSVMEYQEERSRQVSRERPSSVDLRESARTTWAKRRRLFADHEATLTPDQRSTALFYLQIGSYNMNDRSMLLDGEVAMTVAGPAALAGMLDFLTIAGLSTWVETQVELDAILPPPSAFHRLLARWARSLL